MIGLWFFNRNKKAQDFAMAEAEAAVGDGDHILAVF
jgi:hypothetical protein